MLYLIGLGLADETDITVRGLNAVKKCTRVYLESYTSILHIPKERLETFFGKDVIVADREMVESQADEILHNAQNEDIAFLVVGDPFGYNPRVFELTGVPRRIPIWCCVRGDWGLRLLSFIMPRLSMLCLHVACNYTILDRRSRYHSSPIHGNRHPSTPKLKKTRTLASTPSSS